MKRLLGWAWLVFLMAVLLAAIGLAIYEAWPVSGVCIGLLVGLGLTVWAFNAVGLT
jgi:hypothetical protein